MSQLQRRLAAIMFTDIVGYSAMMQKDEVIATRKRKRHKKVFNELTAAYEGQLLQYYGDGTLSIFNSTTAAVECAVALQLALKQEPKVSIRIGIHTGDVTFSEDDIFGDGVNIAARIESLCIPGGIYISKKVYDDIKNVLTLKAKKVGNFELKNIQDKVSVYAISNKGITVPQIEAIEQEVVKEQPIMTDAPVEFKKKKTAALLAIAFGIFGAHRFYLGSKKLGTQYLIAGSVGIISGTGGIIAAVALLSFLDAVLFYVAPQHEFDAKYNNSVSKTTNSFKNQATPKDAQISQQKRSLHKQYKQYKQSARKSFKKYEYEQAIGSLEAALEIKYDDQETHFLLARGYSLIENAQQSLIHLDAAIAFGLSPRKIQYDHALAFLRTRPAYKKFESNNFRLLEDNFETIDAENNTKVQTNQEVSTEDPLLEHLSKLKELRERGYLTEEEFLKQLEKLERRPRE